jgi:hypothetical protein
MLTVWIIAGTLIIVGLASTAVYFQLKLYQQRKRIEQVQHEQAELASQKMLQIQKDIRFLAKAYLDEQVELNELSLRIHHLANCLQLDDEDRGVYRVFDRIAEEIKDIPTHSEWKNLDKATRKKHQKRFIQLESEHKSEAKISAELICGERQSASLH